MSEHRVAVGWTRTSDDFAYENYNRDHKWTFESGQTVEASAAPKFLGNADRVDPEEAFVAAISSCHMLSFLAIAARRRFSVELYEDAAVGYLEETEGKKLSIARAILTPKVVFDGEKRPNEEQIEKMHHQAHEQCFIANSVTTKITIEL